jgi:predicted nuclease of predicted toxin-antitoxin system
LKFLLNMNLSRELGRLLETQGHTWRHARDAGLAEAADSVIVEIAKANGEVILTHDLDYGHLLAFSGDDRPSGHLPTEKRTSLCAVRRADEDLGRGRACP